MIARRRSTPRRSDRVRDGAYMAAVRTMSCLLASSRSTCDGVIEADHVGARGLGQKASDRTCVPLCTRHHGERHSASGAFRGMDQAALRRWKKWAIGVTQLALLHRGVA